MKKTSKRRLVHTLRFMVRYMRVEAGEMEFCAGLGRTPTGKKLLAHAKELRGAADIAEEWVEELEKGRSV